MSEMKHIDAIEYDSNKMISLLDLRVLLQSTWSVARKVQLEEFVVMIRAEIKKRNADTSYAQGQRVALMRLLENVLSKNNHALNGWGVHTKN